MENVQVTFRYPADKLEALDQAAKEDHRDRTSMLHKIIAFYFDNNKPTTPPRKKAGAR
jgi:hypothetical protein